MNHTNIVTKNIQSDAEYKIVDQMINLETKRRLFLVPEAKAFNVWTACFINNQFILVAEYQMGQELLERLESV